MEWKRVKTLLLILLLVCDLGLALNFGWQFAEQRRREVQALEDALSLLEQDGIRVAELQARELKTGLPARIAFRDTDYEKTIMERLLGPCRVTDQGGGVLVYESDRGSVTLRNGGYWEGEAGEAGFLTGLPEALEVENTDRQELWGMELENTGLRLEGRHLTGRWLLVTRSEEAGLSGQREQMLLRLADFLGQPARVLELSQTWLVSGTVGRQVELEPVWRIETGAGVRYMNLRTGQEMTE